MSMRFFSIPFLVLLFSSDVFAAQVGKTFSHAEAIERMDAASKDLAQCIVGDAGRFLNDAIVLMFDIVHGRFESDGTSNLKTVQEKHTAFAAVLRRYITMAQKPAGLANRACIARWCDEHRDDLDNMERHCCARDCAGKHEKLNKLFAVIRLIAENHKKQQAYLGMDEQDGEEQVEEEAQAEEREKERRLRRVEMLEDGLRAFFMALRRVWEKGLRPIML